MTGQGARRYKARHTLPCECLYTRGKPARSALKLWMSLKTFGVEAFRDAVDRGLLLADLAESEIACRDHWEILTPSRLTIVTFRYVPPDTMEQQRDELNRRIAHVLSLSGYSFLSTTALQGRAVLRMCTINPRTSDDDLREAVAESYAYPIFPVDARPPLRLRAGKY